MTCVRGVNLGGTGGHVPPEFGVRGTPMYNVPHILTRIVVLFVVFEKLFNEFDTKVDVIQLAVGIQLLVQHVVLNAT